MLGNCRWTTPLPAVTVPYGRVGVAWAAGATASSVALRAAAVVSVFAPMMTARPRRPGRAQIVDKERLLFVMREDVRWLVGEITSRDS